MKNHGKHIAIGIIILLIALTVTGIRSLNQANKENLVEADAYTYEALENLDDVMALNPFGIGVAAVQNNVSADRAFYDVLTPVTSANDSLDNVYGNDEIVEVYKTILNNIEQISVNQPKYIYYSTEQMSNVFVWREEEKKNYRKEIDYYKRKVKIATNELIERLKKLEEYSEDYPELKTINYLEDRKAEYINPPFEYSLEADRSERLAEESEDDNYYYDYDQEDHDQEDYNEDWNYDDPDYIDDNQEDYDDDWAWAKNWGFERDLVYNEDGMVVPKTYATITSEYANIRDYPGFDSNILGTIEQGRTYPVFDWVDNEGRYWYLIDSVESRWISERTTDMEGRLPL